MMWYCYDHWIGYVAIVIHIIIIVVFTRIWNNVNIKQIGLDNVDYSWSYQRYYGEDLVHKILHISIWATFLLFVMTLQHYLYLMHITNITLYWLWRAQISHSVYLYHQYNSQKFSGRFRKLWNWCDCYGMMLSWSPLYQGIK